MKLLIGVLLAFVANGCGSKIGEQTRDFAFYYKNVNGQDLLNPSTPKSFTGSGIKIYDVVTLNGQTTKQVGATISSNSPATNFLFKDEAGIYYLRYFLRPVVPGFSNYSNGVMINSTQIQLSDSVIDTLYFSHRFQGIPNLVPDTIFYRKTPIFILMHPPQSTSPLSDHTYKITIIH